MKKKTNMSASTKRANDGNTSQADVADWLQELDKRLTHQNSILEQISAGISKIADFQEVKVVAEGAVKLIAGKEALLEDDIDGFVLEDSIDCGNDGMELRLTERGEAVDAAIEALSLSRRRLVSREKQRLFGAKRLNFVEFIKSVSSDKRVRVKINGVTETDPEVVYSEYICFQLAHQRAEESIIRDGVGLEEAILFQRIAKILESEKASLSKFAETRIERAREESYSYSAYLDFEEGFKMWARYRTMKTRSR